MEINDELILQWEPKIVRMLSKTFVEGMDWDDLAQELRISIMKAAHGFDEDRGVIFHTYLHTAMVNTLRTLINKAQKYDTPLSLDTSYYEEETLLDKLSESLSDGLSEVDVELQEFLDSLNLTFDERQYIILRIEGLTMEEISEDLRTSAYKLKDVLRERLEYLLHAGR